MKLYLKAASATTLAAIICCGAASPVHAQSGDAVDLATAVAEVQEEEDRRIVEEQGPADREGFSPSDPTLQLLAASDDKEVSLGITFDSSSVHVDPQDPLKQRAQTTRFSLHGFAPIDKDGGDRFVNLAKPMSGSRLKIGLVHYFSNYTLRQEDINEAVRVMNLSFSNCIRQRVRAWAADQPDDKEAGAKLLAETYITRLEAETTRLGEQGEVSGALAVLDLDDAFNDLEGATNGCRIHKDGFRNNEQLIRRYGMGAAIDSSIRGVTGNAPTYFVGGDAAFGRKNFSFLDRAAFAIQDDDKGEYELSAFAGVIGGNGLWSLRGGVSHSRTYKTQDEVELCQTTSTPGLTQCLSGPDGAPKRNKVTALTLEGRQLFRLGSTKIPIGVAPLLAFDPDNSEYSIEVPIYFAPDKDDKLTGGIQFGYTSEKKNLSFGLFVGVPFTVFQ